MEVWSKYRLYIIWGSVGLLLFAALIAIAAFFDKGYRLGEGFSIVKPGAVEVHGIPENAQIFFDNKSQKFGSGKLRIDGVSPGEHVILITAEGFWPWTKPVSVQNGHTTILVPFLLRQEPERRDVTKQGEFVRLRERVRSNRLPTEKNPILSESGNVSLHAKDGVIYATWIPKSDPPEDFCNPVCLKTAPVFTSVVPLRNLSFLPGRDDVMLISAEDGIFAVELDARGIQNFQPLYQGEAPTFATEGKSIYLFDKGALFELTNFE